MTTPTDETVTFVDTEASVAAMVDLLDNIKSSAPSIYIDVEGENLSRHGTVSILQLYVLPTKQTFLVDVHTLRQASFETPGGDSGRTLRQILESVTIAKVFFDVRNDSDALYSHFGIKLAGVHDLQLMELATRDYSRKFINGLNKCIERDAPLSNREKTAWMQIKKDGCVLFAPEKGGSYAVFNERPLPYAMLRYCAQDVQILPKLWDTYNQKLTATWRAKVLTASADRVAQSQSVRYSSHGEHKVWAPKGWY